MTNTRDNDLQFLDQGRSESLTEEGLKYRQSILDQVYEMSKDDYIEGIRVELIDLVRRKHEAIGRGNTIAFNQAEQNILRLKEKLEAYAKKKYRDVKELAKEANSASDKTKFIV